MKRSFIENHIHLLCLTGSRAYGIHNEDSDYDYKGICILPPSSYFSSTVFEQFEGFKNYGEETNLCTFLNDTDSVIYDIKKYVHLALQNNPNVLEILWINNTILMSDIVRDYLLPHREKFLSLRVEKTYMGYAIAQIRKAETHRKWMIKSQENPHFYDTPPNPKDYGVKENPLRKEEERSFLHFLYMLVKDRIQFSELRDYLEESFDFKGVLIQNPLPDETLEAVQYYTRASSDFITLLHKTQLFVKDVEEYNSYHNWLKNRNKARHEIEAKCGYDGKNLGHCYRLLQTGKELLQGYPLIVDRRETGDADFIKKIRNGQIPYEELTQMINESKDELRQAFKESKLPKNPPIQFFDDLVSYMILRK